MIFTIVIVLIVALIVIAILVNAIQQHREKVEAERRTEIAKQKAIIDETENVLLASEAIPISNRLVFVLHQRVYNALRIIYELNPSAMDVKQRIKDSDERLKSINVNQPPPSHDSFALPDNDKLVIQYIQAIKKFRVILRSEHSKGRVDSQSFVHEDRALASLQLRVNVETLYRRGVNAMNANMLGSARQYFEKAIAALASQSQPDEYNIRRKPELEANLHQIQDNLRNVNAQDREKRREQERDELDELFAPKKKW